MGESVMHSLQLFVFGPKNYELFLEDMSTTDNNTSQSSSSLNNNNNNRDDEKREVKQQSDQYLKQLNRGISHDFQADPKTPTSPT
ncbi:hypothetical protein Syun_012802 [Stephania yunnanensis]|uniref:Uncharacterized protein n=1 Tax=Stephania yunnanensis TaxID=152371 RepID=A0AAP0K2G3_9MAGN